MEKEIVDGKLEIIMENDVAEDLKLNLIFVALIASWRKWFNAS
jgi:hypothetical protein